MATSKRASKKGPARGKSKPTQRFVCDTCGFVAKHAMGLGRHRSARHGVVSQRQARRTVTAEWLTRHEAAERAGVHYNTVRHWERQKLVRKMKQPGVRGMLINASDLARLMSGRAGGSVVPAMSAGDAIAVKALERRLDQLIVGLERVLASVRESRPAGAPAGTKRTAAASKGASKGGGKSAPKSRSSKARASARRSA